MTAGAPSSTTHRHPQNTRRNPAVNQCCLMLVDGPTLNRHCFNSPALYYTRAVYLHSWSRGLMSDSSYDSMIA